MKTIAFFLITIFYSQFATAQSTRPENIVIVTLDGMRWQELFAGADSLLTFDTTASYSHRYVRSHFWAPTPEERRKKLMPFFWSELADKGVIIGNRHLKSYVNNANQYWFSYPGYNEIFTGYPDTAVNSNDKIPNKNITVLEYLNSLPEYKGKVAAFASWDVFNYILNDKRSGIYVNDGFRNADEKLSDRMKMLNQLQHSSPDLFHGGERLDVFTFNMGMEYMKVKKPKIMYFGLGDTDEFAHAGQYDLYMDAARKSDAWIKELWNFIQSTPAYANKTTLLITTDHGRGAALGGNWKHHGTRIEGADQIWIAAIGPSVPANGEAKNGEQLYQGQLAATIAALLGKSYKPAHQPLPAMSLFTSNNVK